LTKSRLLGELRKTFTKLYAIPILHYINALPSFYAKFFTEFLLIFFNEMRRTTWCLFLLMELVNLTVTIMAEVSMPNLIYVKIQVSKITFGKRDKPSGFVVQKKHYLVEQA
jgi:hypothetical protein